MENKVTKIETVTHFDIISSTNGVKFFAKVINKNARKLWNATVAYYRFDTEARRDAWVKDMAGRYLAHQARTDARKAERKNFKSDLKAGDILSGTWGWEQTNVEFYKVLSKKGSTIEIRELGQKTVEGSTYSHGMADMRLPGDNFVADAPIIKKLVRSAYIKINDCISLSKWDGRAEYCSWYG